MEGSGLESVLVIASLEQSKIPERVRLKETKTIISKGSKATFFEHFSCLVTSDLVTVDGLMFYDRDTISQINPKFGSRTYRSTNA